MKILSQIYVILILAIGMPTLLHAQNNDSLILLLINKKNVGESNQIRGVANKLKTSHIAKDINAKIVEIDSTKLEDAFTLLQKQTNPSKNLVIASGNAGIDTLRLMKSKFPTIFSVYLSHQMYDNIGNLLITAHNPNGANLISLPRYAVTDQFRSALISSKTKLIETIGVSHNLNISNIEKEYEKNVLSIPGTTSDEYALVILGGDSQNTDNSWMYFTKKDSLKLAKFIDKSTNKKTYIFVLNGPRTGKHDHSTGLEDLNAHRNESLDPITQTFADYFKNRERFHLFNFKYGQPSLYRALLGKMLHSAESEVFVPAESTSMVSEIVDTLGNKDKIQVFVYENSATSNIHMSHLQSLYKAGNVNVITKNGSSNKKINSKDTTIYSAAQLISDSIIQNWISTK